MQGTVGIGLLPYVRIPDGTFCVASAEGLADSAAPEHDIGITGHVGSRIILPGAVLVYLVTAVAAAEDVAYLEGTLYDDIGDGYVGCIATSIHLADAGGRTTVDNHMRPLSELGVSVVAYGDVVCEVAAAIDGYNLEITLDVAAAIDSAGLVHLDCHRSLGRAVDVVTAKHATVLGSILATAVEVLNVVGEDCAVDGYSHIAIDICGHGCHSRRVAFFSLSAYGFGSQPTQAAAIGIAYHAAREVDRRLLICPFCCHYEEVIELLIVSGICRSLCVCLCHLCVGVGSF